MEPKTKTKRTAQARKDLLVRGVSIAQIKAIQARMPVSESLIVRAALTVLADLTDDQLTNVIRKQAEKEQA